MRGATPLRVCLLGAESTGKTTLAFAMAAALEERGVPVVLVPEFLREWCERAQRTPRIEEQRGIAQEQARQVEAAAARATPGAVVVSDTSPLMVAVYSDMLFGDSTLYPMAIAHLRTFDVVLVTGLDVPWVPDGLQRDGPQVREPVDELLRAALARGGIGYRVVYGQGAARVSAALRALDARFAPSRAKAAGSGWVWVCDKCSDPQCEHRLFTGL